MNDFLCGDINLASYWTEKIYGGRRAQWPQWKIFPWSDSKFSEGHSFRGAVKQKRKKKTLQRNDQTTFDRLKNYSNHCTGKLANTLNNNHSKAKKANKGRFPQHREAAPKLSLTLLPFCLCQIPDRSNLCWCGCCVWCPGTLKPRTTQGHLRVAQTQTSLSEEWKVSKLNEHLEKKCELSVEPAALCLLSTPVKVIRFTTW